MRSSKLKGTFAVAATLALVATGLFGVGGAQAATLPVKFKSAGTIAGSGTDAITGAEAVAVDPSTGNVFVDDKSANRIIEFTSAGQFVLMFGDGVNGTTGGNICTAASGNECKAGVAGSGAGDFSEAYGLTVDDAGHVFVAEIEFEPVGEVVHSYARVQEFTTSGAFVLMFGKKVNATTGGNICTATSGDVCKAAEEGTPAHQEPYSFKFTTFAGNEIAAGGPGDDVYVGNELGVQKYDASGVYLGEISLTGISAAEGTIVKAVAVGKSGEVFVLYPVSFETHTVLEFTETSPNTYTEVTTGGFPLVLQGQRPGGEILAETLAIDAEGRLAVTEKERAPSPTGGFNVNRVSLYDASTGKWMSETGSPNPGSTPSGIGFGAGEEFYIANGNDVASYQERPISELTVNSPMCFEGPPIETDATASCDLTGAANAENVANTVVRFEWGNSIMMGNRTPEIPVSGSTTQPVSATIEGSAPAALVYNRLDGENEYFVLPEFFSSEIAFAPTAPASPMIVREPVTLFAGETSAIVLGEVNPENSETKYYFEYGTPSALEHCVGVTETTGCEGVTASEAETSSYYGPVGSTVELQHLQGGSVYAYRLAAQNATGEARSSIQTLQTGTPPIPTATTGPASPTSPTTAIISGSVNPNGQGATYAFEVGLYTPGTPIQYGIVESGSIPSGTENTPETLLLTGLQPGAQYAYRLTSSNGYGTSIGGTMTFQTQGLPTVLEQPAPTPLLSVPAISFPKPPPTPKKVTKCKRGYKRNAHDKCVKTKTKAKHKVHSKKAEKTKNTRQTLVLTTRDSV